MTRIPPTIDMLPDGSFRQKPQPSVVPLSVKMMLAAAVVTAVGVSVLVAALAVWVVSMILPVVIIAGAGAYALYRFRRWQNLRGQPGPLYPRQPGPFR